MIKQLFNLAQINSIFNHKYEYLDECRFAKKYDKDLTISIDEGSITFYDHGGSQWRNNGPWIIDNDLPWYDIRINNESCHCREFKKKAIAFYKEVIDKLK